MTLPTTHTHGYKRQTDGEWACDCGRLYGGGDTSYAARSAWLAQRDALYGATTPLVDGRPLGQACSPADGHDPRHFGGSNGEWCHNNATVNDAVGDLYDAFPTFGQAVPS